MSLTAECLLDGFDNTTTNLPKIFEDWSHKTDAEIDHDEDLWFSYCQDVKWLTTTGMKKYYVLWQQLDIKTQANHTVRFGICIKRFLSLKQAIKENMGVDIFV